MRAKDVMTSPVVTIGPDTPVTDVAALLLERRISGVPVVDRDGRMVGIVSEGDLLRRQETRTTKRRSRWIEMLVDRNPGAADYIKSHGLRAEDVMTRGVVSIDPDTDLAEVAEVMERERIKRVPVVVDGRPVGIVSRANLLYGLVAYKRSPAGVDAVSDTDIRATIVSRLEDEPWVDRDRVNVVVTDGIVHLWGTVDNDDQRRALRVAAEGVPGVRGVEEHLTPNRFLDRWG